MKIVDSDNFISTKVRAADILTVPIFIYVLINFALFSQVLKKGNNYFTIILDQIAGKSNHKFFLLLKTISFKD